MTDAAGPREQAIRELARDVEFAIDVTLPREVLLKRFENTIRQWLDALRPEEPPPTTVEISDANNRWNKLALGIKDDAEIGRPEEPPPQQCPLCKNPPTAKAGTAMAICSDDDHRVLICRDCARDVGKFFGLKREYEAEVASLRAQLTQFCGCRHFEDGTGTTCSAHEELEVQLAEAQQARDKWLAAFNRSEQFQNGPKKRAEAAEAIIVSLRAQLTEAQQARDRAEP